MRFTTNTPWGKADHCEELGNGVVSCSTPSHGGIFVPENMLHHISVDGRNYAKRWSGSEQWYEEDCGWAFVALALPSLFPVSVQDAARRTVASLRKNNF